MRKGVLAWGILVLVIALILIGGVILGHFDASSALLTPLPEVPNATPALLVQSRGKAFPLHLTRALAGTQQKEEGAFIQEMRVFLPVVASADRVAILLVSEEDRLHSYLVLQLPGGMKRALSEGKIPEEWKSLLPQGTLSDSGHEGIWRLSTSAMDWPLYVASSRKFVLVSHNLEDVSEMIEVEARGKHLKHRWSIERGWPNHLWFTDGGKAFPIQMDLVDSRPPLLGEVAWRVDPKEAGRGEAYWKLWGLKQRLPEKMYSSLRPISWEETKAAVAQPSFLELGVNFPLLPEDLSGWPVWANFPLGTLERTGLSREEAKEFLRGPLVLSLGGHTKVLWFSFPGFLVDFQNRGRVGEKFVDQIWSDLLMGAKPVPVEGYSKGGATDLPFSLVAASDGARVAFGLMDVDAVKDRLVLKEILNEQEAKEAQRSFLWMTADLPRISEAMGEMYRSTALLSGENISSEDPGIEALRTLFHSMGRLTLIMKTVDEGHLLWQEAERKDGERDESR